MEVEPVPQPMRRMQHYVRGEPMARNQFARKSHRESLPLPRIELRGQRDLELPPNRRVLALLCGLSGIPKLRPKAGPGRRIGREHDLAM
jgi:hypothetical protein